jgi:tryptophan synthase alpha chain
MTPSQRFAELNSKGEKALVCFFTAGDQPLADLPKIVGELIENGADLVEIGIPFSDPFGEGPTIQASSQRALDAGTTPEAILDAIALCPQTVPLIPMGYYNPVLRMGLEEFARRSASAGCSGTIISDLVPDEASAWDAASLANGLETIYLVAPTSTQSRIEQVCAQTTGFVYAVSRTGVTGAERAVPPEVHHLIASVRARTSKPVAVGFGISTPEHVRMVCETADGAVVGSAIVSLLHKSWGTPGAAAELGTLIRSLKAATR